MWLGGWTADLWVPRLADWWETLMALMLVIRWVRLWVIQTGTQMASLLVLVSEPLLVMLKGLA